MGHPVVQPRPASRIHSAPARLDRGHRLLACRPHFDVDTIDSNEILLGLGPEPYGLTSAEVRRIVTDIDRAVAVVGFTIAEFIPRQVMHLQQLLRGFPLVSGTTAR